MKGHRLHISTFIEKGSLKVFLDDNLLLAGSGEFEMSLDHDQVFELKWVVESRPQTNFRVSLFEPSDLSFSHVRLVGGEGKECGMKLLKT